MLFYELQKYVIQAIDILIVSYVVYKILYLLRGTRAIMLLRGILVLFILWLVSKYLHLTTLRWLIENFSSVGVIAGIIIFQPELRRALEQLGRGKLFSKFNNREDSLSTRIIRELVTGVSNLSEGRIGALIVIQKNKGLIDYIETGTELNAKLTSELIQSIFTHKTPLHDGAVILNNDIIVAAGCFLPLSDNPYISKNLGTRHRAGIGISEVSDAIAIIVSEETGGISVAIHGKLERGLNEEELLSQLFEELNQSSKKKGRS